MSLIGRAALEENERRRARGEKAAKQALEEGYTCAEKYELGACNVSDPITNGDIDPVHAPRKTMFPPGTIETFTGDVYNFENPDVASIHLEDIAHALSNHCRYAGHTKRFYSVGEHSVLVSRIIEEQGGNTASQILGLFHDAHEAYVMDAPRPLKPLLGAAFKEVADKADVAVAQWLSNATRIDFAPQYFNMPTIKRADNMALVHERKQLMTAGLDEWEAGYEDVPELPGPLANTFVGYPPEPIEGSFLQRAYELGVENI